MTGTVYTCLHTNQSRSYLNHLVYCTDYIYKFLYTHKITKDVGNYVCVLYNAVRNAVLNLRSANISNFSKI